MMIEKKKAPSIIDYTVLERLFVYHWYLAYIFYYPLCWYLLFATWVSALCFHFADARKGVMVLAIEVLTWAI